VFWLIRFRLEFVCFLWSCFSVSPFHPWALLKVRNVVWNWSLLKKIVNRFNSVAFVEISYLNADMCKFESLQKEDSRAQSADSSKAYNKLWAVTADVQSKHCAFFWETVVQNYFNEAKYLCYRWSLRLNGLLWTFSSISKMCLNLFKVFNYHFAFVYLFIF